MADYEISDEPIYNAKIRRLENSDPASANPTFNPLISRLIENTAAVKNDAEGRALIDLSNVSNDVFKNKSVESGTPENVASKDELDVHVNDGDIHVSADQTEVYQIAVVDLGKHVNDTDIHVNAEKQTLWTDGVHTAEQGAAEAQAAMEKALKNERLIAELELSMYSNVTKNPFSVGFDTLTGIKIIKGVWNKGKQRIEC